MGPISPYEPYAIELAPKKREGKKPQDKRTVGRGEGGGLRGRSPPPVTYLVGAEGAAEVEEEAGVR
jgi:hypothetical protein